VRYPALADERRRLEAWLAAAPGAGFAEVLLAVKASRDGAPVPDPAGYRRGLDALLAWVDARGGARLVRAVSPWNEPNLDGPSRIDPALAGRFFAQVAALCSTRGCTPVAGDFADAAIAPADLAAYRVAAGPAARVWAWHAYDDAWDRERDATFPRLRAFLRALPREAEVWLTEQGGIVRRGRPGPDGRIAQTPSQASADLGFLLERAAETDERIARFYVYQWQGEAPPRWDSGLIAPDGQARAGYCAVARAAGRPGVPAC
jgi:hypothetical protein